MNIANSSSSNQTLIKQAFRGPRTQNQRRMLLALQAAGWLSTFDLNRVGDCVNGRQILTQLHRLGFLTGRRDARDSELCIWSSLQWTINSDDKLGWVGVYTLSPLGVGLIDSWKHAADARCQTQIKADYEYLRTVKQSLEAQRQALGSRATLSEYQTAHFKHNYIPGWATNGTALVIQQGTHSNNAG